MDQSAQPLTTASIIVDIQGVALVLLLAVASYWDCKCRRIPNWLTFCGVIVGAVLALLSWVLVKDTPEKVFPGQVQGSTFGAAFGSVLGLICAGGSMLLVYLCGGFGGGDVKLACGVGLLTGYPKVVEYLFYGLLAALAIMLGRLAWDGNLASGLGNAFGSKKGILKPGEADKEARDEETKRIFMSFSPAWLLGVLWVWVMGYL